jgi:hypothetical protein
VWLDFMSEVLGGGGVGIPIRLVPIGAVIQ